MQLGFKIIAVILMSSAATSMALADTACTWPAFLCLRICLPLPMQSGPACHPWSRAETGLRAQVNVQRRETNELPIDLSLSAQSFREDNINTGVEADKEVSEVSLNIGLDIWNEHARRKVSQAKLDGSLTDLERIDNQIASEILRSAVDISETLELISIFETRDNLLVTKVEYYTLREKLGETVSRDLLQARTDQIENQNKLISARVKLSSLAGKINIGLAQSEKLPRLSPYHSITSDFACNDEDYLVREARNALKLAESRFLQRKMDLSLQTLGICKAKPLQD